jgi:histidinol-phosphate phosphatase family protein
LKTVFLDRDGVINRNRDDYVKCVSEFEFLPGAKDALRKLNKAGFRVVVISNQQGVGKGLISHEDLDEINRQFVEGVAESGGRIDGIYYCPHLSIENCDCRKPATGLLERASCELDFPLREAILVGDAASDIEAGKRSGCWTIAVLTGRLSEAEIRDLPVQPDEVAPDLAAAVDRILEREQKKTRS